MRELIDSFGLSDVGTRGGKNEDQFLVADLERSILVRQTSLDTEDDTRLFGGSVGHLFLVADGVGGANGGRKASRLTVRALTRYVLSAMPWFARLDEADLRDDLASALEACHQAVAVASAEPGMERMSSTVTLAYVLWPKAYIVHAGDSRAYVARRGRLRRVTHDHTIAQSLADRGTLTQAEADQSRWSRVLTKCVSGSDGIVAPDITRVTLREGDTLLLCTDGLSKAVSDERIEKLLSSGRAREAAHRLVAAANQAESEDNVTVVVARFLGNG